METNSNELKRSQISRVWFLVGVLGAFYIYSFAVFKSQSKDFYEIHKLGQAPEVPVPFHMDFSESEVRKDFLVTGWSFPESWGCWTIGSRSTVMFRSAIADPLKRYALDLEIVNYFSGDVWSSKRLELRIGDRKAGVLKLRNKGELPVSQRLEIEGSELANGVYLILAQNHVSRPVAFFLNGDHRKLGLGVASLKVTEIEN